MLADVERKKSKKERRRGLTAEGAEDAETEEKRER
jgi:hypothetical protein